MLFVSPLILSLVACDGFTLKIEEVSSDEPEACPPSGGGSSGSSRDPSVDPTVDTGVAEEEAPEAPPQAGCLVDILAYGTYGGATEWSIRYDEEGREVEYIYPYDTQTDIHIYNEYDPHGNLSEVRYDYPGSDYDISYTYTYVYDEDGRLIEVGMNYDGLGEDDQTTVYVYENDTHRTSYILYNNYPQTYATDEYLDSDGHILYQRTDYDDGYGGHYVSTMTAAWDGDHKIYSTYAYDQSYPGYPAYHYDYTEMWEYEDGAAVQYSYFDNADTYDYSCDMENNDAGQPLVTICTSSYRDEYGNEYYQPTTTTTNTYDSAGRNTHITYEYTGSPESTYEEDLDWTCPV